MEFRAVDVIILKCITPWNRVFIERVLDPQQAKKFRTFYGTNRFFISFTTAPCLSHS